LPRYQQLTTRIHANHVQIYLHEEGLGSPLPASRVSDGTLRMIALITILLRPELASLLCIDEPELGLHPDAMQLIADLLIEASGRTQIIVATHSDALVSALTNHAESVVVCEYRNGTVMQRLDSERLRFWLDQYCLGELWRIGELGGNP
jgi:predicted ATPase